MIVSRTPFRVTLGGGGTDLPSYYEKHGGMIFAMALNKYMYVNLNRPVADDLVRLHYTQSEQVANVSELKHELAREALKLHGIHSGIEIASLADIPAGTGVGSSSCYLVGLLNAIRQYKRDYCSLQHLAEEACHIELDVLKKNIGKQDQYMAAFGGLTFLEIAKDGKVKVESVNLSESAMIDLIANTHIYYTGVRRNTEEILQEQHQAMQQVYPAQQTVADSLHFIKDLGYRIMDAIKSENFDAWGNMLHEHWVAKKKLSNKISLSQVDKLYDEVRAHYNVLGGKIIGAGGGGFFMLYCTQKHRELEDFMRKQGMARLHYQISTIGSTVVSDFVTRSI